MWPCHCWQGCSPPGPNMTALPYAQRICAAKYHIPSRIRLSEECVDLLRRIFVVDPRQRITLRGIQQHPWFLHRDLPDQMQVLLKLLHASRTWIAPPETICMRTATWSFRRPPMRVCFAEHGSRRAASGRVHCLLVMCRMVMTGRLPMAQHSGAVQRPVSRPKCRSGRYLKRPGSPRTARGKFTSHSEETCTLLQIRQRTGQSANPGPRNALRGGRGT